MSSDEYVSRADVNPELTPMERVLKRWRPDSYMPFPLQYQRYTDEQKFAIVLEALVRNQKEHLAMMNICIIAAAAFLESKHRKIKDWCDAYLEHYDLSALRSTTEDDA